jgi:hypothetical protein
VNHRNAYCNIKNWTGWLEKALLISQDSEAGVVNGEGFSADFKRHIAASSGEAPASMRFAESLINGRKLNIAASPEAVRASDELFERCAKVDISHAKMARRLSVSQALDYNECPARYHLLYDIGIPEEDMDRDDIPVEAGDHIGAADLGMEAHRILSELDFGHDLQPQIESLLGHIDNPALKVELEPLLLNFAGSSWARELAVADAVVKERPFELRVGGTVLVGRMDVAYHGTDGWTVLDYKTGRGDDSDRYRLQVGIYAHAAFGLLHEPPARTAVFNLRSGVGQSENASDGSIARLAAERVVDIAKGIGAGNFDPAPGAACAHCRLSLFCRKDLIPVK